MKTPVVLLLKMLRVMMSENDSASNEDDEAEMQATLQEGLYNKWYRLSRCEVCLRYFTKSLRATVFMQTVYSTVVQGYS